MTAIETITARLEAVAERNELACQDLEYKGELIDSYISAYGNLLLAADKLLLAWPKEGETVDVPSCILGELWEAVEEVKIIDSTE